MKILKRFKKEISLMLTLALCIPGLFSLNAYAEEKEKGPVIDSDELDELIEATLDGFRTNKSDVSVALYYTGSGEYYYYNADKWLYSASLYKLPVCMKYMNLIKTGEYKANSFKVEDKIILDAILVHSNGGWPMVLAKRMFGQKNVNKYMREQDLKFSGLDESLLPKGYYDKSDYSARFYLGILEELYNNSDEYPQIIDYMKKASPHKYLKVGVEKQYEVAQKYGSAGGTVAGAGFIYTPDPIIIVIMTGNKTDPTGNKIVGAISQTVTNYITGA